MNNSNKLNEINTHNVLLSLRLEKAIWSHAKSKCFLSSYFSHMTLEKLDYVE